MNKISDSPSKLQQIKAPPSLRAMAYASIKEAIMTNILKPGLVYNEQGLGNELGMSKTPVHEALIDLSSRGFVTLRARRGVLINTLTTQDIIKLYSFRQVIESGIIRSIADKFKDTHLERLKVLHNRCLDASVFDGMVNYLKLERAFHDYMASLSQNEYMISALENVRDLIDWMGLKALTRTERMLEVNQEHEEVLTSIAERNFADAALSMEKHISITLKNVLNHQSE